LRGGKFSSKVDEIALNCFNFRKEWVNVDACEDVEARVFEGIIRKVPFECGIIC